MQLPEAGTNAAAATIYLADGPRLVSGAHSENPLGFRACRAPGTVALFTVLPQSKNLQYGSFAQHIVFSSGPHNAIGFFLPPSVEFFRRPCHSRLGERG